MLDAVDKATTFTFVCLGIACLSVAIMIPVIVYIEFNRDVPACTCGENCPCQQPISPLPSGNK